MKRIQLILLAVVLAGGIQTAAWAEPASAEGAAAASQSRFTDTRGHWAEATVDRLVEQGVLDGYPDGTFRPDEPVAADQFIKILLLSFTDRHQNGERSWKPAFVDSLSQANRNMLRQDYRDFSFRPSTVGYWAKPYIDLAADLHLLERSEFPDFKIGLTRERVAELLYYTLKETEYLEDEDYSGRLSATIGDLKAADDRHRKFIAESFSKGIMEGYPNGFFGVGKAVTRAESLTIVERLTDKSKRVEPPAGEADRHSAVVPTKDGRYKRLLFPNETMKELYGVMEQAGKLRGTNYDLEETTLLLFKDAEAKANALSPNRKPGDSPAEASIWMEPKYETYGFTLRLQDGALARNLEPIRLFANRLFGYEASAFDNWFLNMYGNLSGTKPFEPVSAEIGSYTAEASSPDRASLVVTISPVRR